MNRQNTFEYCKKDKREMKLLRLSKPARINHFVKSVALPSSCAPSGTICTTAGWGNTMSSTADSGMFSQVHFRGKCSHHRIDSTLDPIRADFISWKTSNICSAIFLCTFLIYRPFNTASSWKYTKNFLRQTTSSTTSNYRGLGLPEELF